MNLCKKPDESIQVASAVLSQKYEERLFHGNGQGRVVPALVITGFLGAGKTTLLQHLLCSCSGYLKLGVLVNEVAHLDVDSQLLNTQQSNAAAGIKAAHLAGGCACCSVSADLQAALSEMASSINYQKLDYLLLETSGVADAEPLAASLTTAGFRLTAVVAVVDAEAGLAVLEQPIAMAQLCAADVVVLNKCDLASLAAVSAVEDRVQELAPGVRMLRVRFGQVPAEALLDVDPAPEQTHYEPQQQQQQQQGVQGEIAFLSHEPSVSTARRSKEPVISKRAKAAVGIKQQPPPIAHSSSKGSQQHHEPHHHPPPLHSSLSGPTHNTFTSTSVSTDEPLCMACFQRFVADKLVTSKGLFRAKGFLCFQQQRNLQYVFHLSGKQRVECAAEGDWQRPPVSQLVLIGQDHQQLQQLHDLLLGCSWGRCSCCCWQATTTAAAPGALAADSSSFKQEQVVGRMNAAAAAVAEQLHQHHRFEVLPEDKMKPDQTSGLQQQQQQQQQQLGGLWAGSLGLVQFSAVGSPLHGVVADEVNAAVLRKANSTPGVFLCHIKSPARLAASSAAGRQQVAYQGVKVLQLCWAAGSQAADAVQFWQGLEGALAPVLRKAYQHVHNCKCDVAEALQLMGQ